MSNEERLNIADDSAKLLTDIGRIEPSEPSNPARIAGE